MCLRMTPISLKKVSTFCCEGWGTPPREFDAPAHGQLGPSSKEGLMPRKKIQAPLPRPVLFFCLNCDQPMTLIRQVKLFCSEACADEAKLVRYARRCFSDGRINQTDVQEAIQIRIAHALSGGYSERERRVLPSVRSAVIARDGGRCQKCGQPGTDIDHIHGS